MSWSDIGLALRGVEGWPVWVIGLVAVAFVVWRGLIPVAWGNTSLKRVHPTRAALSIFGGLVGLGFLVTYTIARILERHARLRAQEILGDVALEAIPSSSLPFSVRDEVVRYSSLGAGVVFLVFLVATLLPLALDLLERSAFTPFVAARHVRATKSGFLTVISVLSILGVCVSSCALCSVTSVMGGFANDLKQKILGNNPHVVIDGKRPGGFDEWEPALEQVRAALGPDGAATPVVAGDAMSQSASNTAGVLVKGIDPESIGKVIDLEKNIDVGRFSYLSNPEALANIPAGEVICKNADGTPRRKIASFFDEEPIDPKLDPALREFRKPPPSRPGVILGRELAKSLHVCVGDEVTLLSPMGELLGSAVMPRTRKFRVAAIFYSAMYEYDASHAYILIDQAQNFFSLDDKISQIDVRVSSPEGVESFAGRIDGALAAAYEPGKRPDNAPPPPELRVRDWKQMNKNLFSALKLERIATFMILSVAIIVASFCIVCTLLLMVTEKTRQIAIMKALGASDGAVQRIFILEGMIIGAIGTLFGVGIALAASTGLKWFGARLPPEVYYIDRLPVNVDLADYGLVALSAMLICTVSTLYPAYAASRISPVDGLRYE
ncbi:MAG: ABC transporter permease [Polyangiaceae bacterium]|jgi:lipoprotein-releasing system permease protein|nr:ABC transporter permease [Polyangiaceae bacterium]MBK8941124.1 ABC transporter permease [Polyangiaceae bacterium]